MQEGYLEVLAGSRPLIKRRWLAFLRQVPPKSALANPETLAFLMDETLDEWLRLLARRSPPTAIHSVTRWQNAIHGRCFCSVNPLLAYFVTGEAAIKMVLHEVMDKFCDTPARTRERRFDKATQTFHAIGHHELNALCGICQEEACPLSGRQKPASARA